MRSSQAAHACMAGASERCESCSGSAGGGDATCGGGSRSSGIGLGRHSIVGRPIVHVAGRGGILPKTIRRSDRSPGARDMPGTGENRSGASWDSGQGAPLSLRAVATSCTHHAVLKCLYSSTQNESVCGICSCLDDAAVAAVLRRSEACHRPGMQKQNAVVFKPVPGPHTMHMFITSAFGLPMLPILPPPPPLPDLQPVHRFAVDA